MNMPNMVCCIAVFLIARCHTRISPCLHIMENSQYVTETDTYTIYIVDGRSQHTDIQRHNISMD